MSFRQTDAAVALEDGRIFRGTSIGAPLDAEGEVVFTTTMTGYQEVATDPSFRGQIVCMTYPIIGNYGVTPLDEQSRQPWISGMIVRDYCDWPSNWRSTGTLGDYFKEHNLPAIAGVDTRALTRHLRTRGAMRGVLCAIVGERTDEDLRAFALRAWSPAGHDVIGDVTRDEAQLVGDGELHVVLIDCGVKTHIIESLERRGVRITVVPFDTTLDEIMALGPDGVLTSPGPGDPEDADAASGTIRGLVESGTPYLGVCMGHQLLALAIGAETSKLKFGHRGGNHPVLDYATRRVYITAQNHGYQVDADSVPTDRGWRVSQINLNDGSVEGIAHDELPAFSVQYHPEGSPGPQDNQYVFDRFVGMVRAHRARRIGVAL